ncbi:MAG: ribosome biogenesis GTPase YqeH, partial [Bacilli bacterium]|nr:ribosome biogenesis GTPase YqeH [Bacilli bacterium]
MNKICYGCGAKLQTEDKGGIGYIPLKKAEDAKYCMRCFRLMHYGEQAVNETPKDVKEIVNK